MNRLDTIKEKPSAPARSREKQYIADLSETKELRNSYTQNFLRRRLPSSVKPNAFLVKACKALGIKPSAKILENVISIQRKLKFPEIPKQSRLESYGFAEYIDGKFGQYTLQNLLKHEKGKGLATIFPDYQKAKRKSFAKKEGFPPTSNRAPVVNNPEIKRKAKRVAYIADSNGTKWFLGRHLKEINGRPTMKIVKGGMAARWARNRIKENIDRFLKEGVTDVVVMIGTNNMSTRASLAYIRRPVERDPVVKLYIEMRRLLREKGIRFHLCTIPPLGGYIAKKYARIRSRLNGLRATYWRKRYWDKIPRVIKRRYNNDPLAYYKAAEQACYTRWLNVNRWIMAQKLHINFGNAQTVTLPRKKSSDGIHITGRAEQRRMAKKIKDRFS